MKPSWGRGWSIDLRVWIHRAGQAILGPGRLELLEGIERWHSISAAARHMGMSYRRAWDLVQSINHAAGDPLVSAAVGGQQGGGAQLTELGRWAVGVFREIQQQVRLTAAATLPRLVEPSDSAVLHVAAAASLEEVLRDLLATYALQQPTVKVQAVFGASDELATHILAGAPADVFLTADAGPLERLEAAGLVTAGTRQLLATTALAAITQQDRDMPVSKPVHLKKKEAGRIALPGPESPAGRYTQTYLESVHLLDKLAARAVWVENSRAVVAAIRSRQADVGLVYASDAFQAEGCRILFQIPRLPVTVEFTGAAVQRGQGKAGINPAARNACELLEFLASPTAASTFLRFGFVPQHQPEAQAR
ncbi:MAG TPA: molybdate ABC transporter substrate-binding protein [Gemmataceae bacterium]|nr:molybdate ABC transporter substrate-binding protein [Gemmataceae bacterium]